MLIFLLSLGLSIFVARGKGEEHCRNPVDNNGERVTSLAMNQNHESLENLLQENRHFLPSPEFAAQANAQPDEYAYANMHRLAFWDMQARQLT